MSEKTLHFDLSRSAGRRAIFGQAVAATEEDCRGPIATVINDESIPKAAHLHDIAAVEKAIDTTVASAWAKEQAKQVYRILAKAEARVHGCPVEQTHFHEVGEGMTCREILGICTAIEQAAPKHITATAVQVGSGQIECAHGVFDVPAPATAAILQEYNIPIVDEKLEGELCTPTSAALIAHFVEEYK